MHLSANWKYYRVEKRSQKIYIQHGKVVENMERKKLVLWFKIMTGFTEDNYSQHSPSTEYNSQTVLSSCLKA